MSSDAIGNPQPRSRPTLDRQAENAGDDGSITPGEARYRALMRATADIVWTATPEGAASSGMPEWRAFTGQTLEQVAEFGSFEAIHPEDRANSKRGWLESVANGANHESEERLRRHDGVYRLMRVRAVPVRDSAGNIVEWVGMHTDITEQRALEDSLRRRERDLKEAYRLASLGSWWWDVEANTVTWTEEVYRVFEVDPQLPPPNFEELEAYHFSDTWQQLRGAVARLLETGEPYAIDNELKMKDGRSKWIAARGEVEAREHGRVSRVRGTIQDITERKERLHAEQRANQRLESVLASIHDGLAVFGKDWVYTYFNEQGARLLGVPVNDLVGRSAWDVFPGLKDSKFYSESLRAIETGRPVEFEEYIPEPLGLWLECSCYPGAEGASIYFRDITERKRTEEALRASETRFRKLFDSDLMGVCIPDRFGAFYEGNDEFLRIVGYSRADLEAGLVRWDTMTPPEYAALDAAHIAEAAQRGSCTPYEKEYIRKDGTRVPISCGYALLEGSEDIYVGFIQDRTAQNLAEKALKEREQRFSLLAESLPQLIFIADPEGSNFYCNRRLLSYAGTTESGEANIRWENLIHPDDLQVAAQKWAHCRETGESYLDEHRLRRHDGVYRWFLASAVPLRNDAGEIERWLGSSTDIHDQKQAEEALRRSEKLAATGRLAASVAHEINNPLSSVTNAIYLALQDQSLSETTRNWLRMADEELVRVAHVTTQTLRFFRQSTAPTLVDVSQVMDAVLEIFGSRFRSFSGELERDYRGSEKLHCFSDELRQVFANLIGNGLDAMAQSGRFRIRIANGRAWGGSAQRGVVVTIADTGCGIPAGLRKQVFEPFVSTKGDTGTGLGLWVSQGIVRKHKGRIALRSSTRPDRHGTVFSIFLPFDGIAQGENRPGTESSAP